MECLSAADLGHVRFSAGQRAARFCPTIDPPGASRMQASVLSEPLTVLWAARKQPPHKVEQTIWRCKPEIRRSRFRQSCSMRLPVSHRAQALAKVLALGAGQPQNLPSLESHLPHRGLPLHACTCRYASELQSEPKTLKPRIGLLACWCQRLVLSTGAAASWCQTVATEADMQMPGC